MSAILTFVVVQVCEVIGLNPIRAAGRSHRVCHKTELTLSPSCVPYHSRFSRTTALKAPYSFGDLKASHCVWDVKHLSSLIAVLFSVKAPKLWREIGSF